MAVKKAKKGKSFQGFKPSPYKAEPIGKRITKPKPAPEPELQLKPEPAPQPKPKEADMAKEHPKLDKIKETASRIASKIRNLENKINAARSTPPDPEIAAEFDGIQRDVEELKNSE